MAVIPPTVTTIKDAAGNEVCRQVIWGPMVLNDVGGDFSDPHFADRSIQVKGTFGAAGNCRIQGTNTGLPAIPPAAAVAPADADYLTLNDPQGLALDITAAALKEVSECSLWIRPKITAGDVTTSLTVTMVCRRSR